MNHQHPSVPCVLAWPLLCDAPIPPDLSFSPFLNPFYLCFISTTVPYCLGSSLGDGANHDSDAADSVAPWGATRAARGCPMQAPSFRQQNGKRKAQYRVHRAEVSTPPWGDEFWSLSGLAPPWTCPSQQLHHQIAQSPYLGPREGLNLSCGC